LLELQYIKNVICSNRVKHMQIFVTSSYKTECIEVIPMPKLSQVIQPNHRCYVQITNEIASLINSYMYIYSSQFPCVSQTKMEGTKENKYDHHFIKEAMARQLLPILRSLSL
jgi:hypothetical protein